MNANKTIHEAMGLCWHTWKDNACVKCKMSQFEQDCMRDFPSYTSPVHYCALMDWMRREGRWWEFDKWNRVECANTLMSFLELEKSDQISLIAEAIEDGVLN